MQQEISFEAKVKSMTAREIILETMEGLRNPKCEIRMATFGGSKDGICFGCAATNAVMRISGVVFNTDNIMNNYSRTEAIKSDIYFLKIFEFAINDLRNGCIGLYNIYAKQIGIARIPVTADLPILTNDFTESDLKKYEDFANTLN